MKDRFLRHTIQSSTSGKKSTELIIETDTDTGESEIILSTQISEIYELNKANLEIARNKFKELNPSQGWVIGINKLIEFINK